MNVTPVISAEIIEQCVTHLAKTISAKYADRDVVLLVVLKGAVVFAADLMRKLSLSVEIDFVRARSYDGTTSSGNVTLTYTPEIPLKDRDVIIVEDILDTGRTSLAIREWVRSQCPASIALCVLLDKPSRRTVDIEADFRGVAIENHFVVGYGLDYDEQGRQFPNISILNRDSHLLSCK